MTNEQILSLYQKAKVISDKDSFLNIIENRTKSQPIASDTETTGTDFHTESILYPSLKRYNVPYVFGISFAILKRGKIHLAWIRHDDTKFFKAACSIISKDYWKVAHNARYDIRVLEENGYKTGGEIECTYTMSRIYWDRRMKHSLKSLAEFLCPELSNWDQPIKEEMTKLKKQYKKEGIVPNFSFIPNDIMAKYSMLDSFLCLILWMYLNEKAIWK